MLLVMIILIKDNNNKDEATYNVCVRFPTRHPLSSLESPVIRISEYHIHKYIVVSGWVEARNVEA